MIPSLSKMCDESYQAFSPPSTGLGLRMGDWGHCEVIGDLGDQFHQSSNTSWPPQSLLGCAVPTEVCRDPLSGHGFAICLNWSCEVECDDGLMMSSDGKDGIHQGYGLKGVSIKPHTPSFFIPDSWKSILSICFVSYFCVLLFFFFSFFFGFLILQ